MKFISRYATRKRLPMVLVLASVFSLGHAVAADFDEDAAHDLAKKSNCFKCHSIDKVKKAPSYAKVAAKYKGRSDAEAALYKHLTGRPTVKLDDADEQHEPPAGASEAEIRNLIRWILSRGG